MGGVLKKAAPIGGAIIGGITGGPAGAVQGFSIGSAVAGAAKGPKTGPAPTITTTDPFEVENLLSNTRRRFVKGPDGRQRVVIEEIERDPQEQALIDNLKNLRAQTAQTITDLSSIEAAINIEQFKPVIRDQRSLLDKQVTQQFEGIARRQEEQLAQRGISDSTAATELRSVREGIEQATRQQNELNLSLTAENLRNSALQRAGAANTLAESFLQQQFSNAINASANVGNLGAQAQSTQLQGQTNLFNQRMSSFGVNQELAGQYGGNVSALTETLFSKLPKTWGFGGGQDSSGGGLFDIGSIKTVFNPFAK